MIFFLFSLQKDAKCAKTEDVTQMALILDTTRWSNISKKKQEIAIKKLSKHFHVPKVKFLNN